jgi:hypothetical protein
MKRLEIASTSELFDAHGKTRIRKCFSFNNFVRGVGVAMM